MTLKVRATPTFERVAKKLHARDKKTVDDVVLEIVKKPSIGVEKKGDLAGVFVYKFKLNKQEVLLSYKLEPKEVVLLSLGSHENFYRELKR